MKAQLNLKLALLREKQLYRQLKEQNSYSSTKAVINGLKTTVFASNDYLGLANHPEVKKAAQEALEKYGTSASASRLISGNHQLYQRLETALAAFKNKEAALVFSSGYLANLSLLATLAEPNSVIYFDRLNHASLYDGWQLSGAVLKRYQHTNLKQLEKQLQTKTKLTSCFIVTDGVFSMDGDLAPLPALKDLAKKYNCSLVVDDAHGTGVVGPSGKGTAAYWRTEADIEIGTLSKALASLGGFVVASKEVKEYLVNKARPFIFTTALPPACLAAALAALTVMQNEGWRQERLLALAKKVRTALKEQQLNVPAGITPIIPIIVGSEALAVKLAQLCWEKGVFIPAIRYPAVPKNKARLRMTLSANHTDQEVEKAVEVIVTASKEVGLVA